MPYGRVKDGTMQELINLRPRDGALRTVGKKKDELLSLSTDVLHIHYITGSKKIYVGKDEDGFFINYRVFIDGVQSGNTQTTDLQATSLLKFSSWQNVLMVSEGVNETTSMMIFNEETNLYDVYDGFGGLSLLPEMPHVSFTRLANATDDDSKTFTATAETVADAMLAEYVKMQNDKTDAGYITGCILLRCAWEMVDGTIIKQTLPDKVYLSEISTTYNLSTFVVTSAFTAYKLQFKLNCTTAWLDSVKTKYKNIIKGLNIYVSSPRSPELEHKEHQVRSGTSTLTTSGGPARTYDVASLSEYIPNIEEEAYYFLKNYSLESLTANALVTLGLESVLDLNTRSQMPMNNLSHHTLHGKRLFTYNDRIFLGDIKNYLHEGRSIEGLIGPGNNNTPGTEYKVGIEFDIAISTRKTVTVFSYWTAFNYYNLSDGNIEFWVKYQEITTGGVGRRLTVRNDNSYWGYPDARAKTARIYITDDNGLTVHLAGTYNMTSIQSQNFSYCNGVKVKCTLGSLPFGTITYGKNYYYDRDRIQATELGNPFYYPAINSYRVQGTVLGLSTNAIALSTGQFGQFPMFCFTSQGIWTMGIGSGETLINTITPLSREVCNNPDSITPIDGGSAFTTEKGLSIISGNQVIEISQTAEGSKSGPISETIYNTIANNPSLYEITGYLCTQTFLTYITGAVIAWDYINKELIISNNDYSYSWVYSADYKTWFKISESFKSFVTDFPVVYGIKIIGEEYIGRIETFFNWYAVNDTRGLAPPGWHVPTSTEWATLTSYLGGIYVAGGKMKEVGLVNWEAPNAGATNEVGFNGIGAGYRNYAGYYQKFKQNLSLWTSSEINSAEADSMYMYYNYESTAMANSDKHMGLSVRYIKDDDNDPGEMTGNDGKIYKTIKIGNQVWMAENSQETQYANHDFIPIYSDNVEWEGATTGASCLWDFKPYISYNIFDLTREDFTDPVPVHVETRPLKMSPQSFKKVHRLLVHGYIPALLKPFTVNLLGSLNGYQWYLLNNGKFFGEKESLLIGRSTFSCRYFILVTGGEVDEMFYLTHLDVDIEERYFDKLR